MDKKEKLEQIEKNINVCEKCRLCKTATNPVPGYGDTNAEIVFVGEAPGRNEDLQGKPFVGRAGRLLDGLLEKIGMHRNQVWVGNIIKHRPPENRDPFPDEIASCEPYLTMQLQVLDPKLIVTLGRFALNYFYKDGKISRDHGCLINLGKYRVYPVYHPAAALRNPSMAVTLAQDFKKLPGVLEGVKNGDFDKFINVTASEEVDENQTTLF